MKFRVETTARSERDFDGCYEYIANRSRQGAARWANAFASAVLSLEENPVRSLAPESADHEEDIYQKFLKPDEASRTECCS